MRALGSGKNELYNAVCQNVSVLIQQLSLLYCKTVECYTVLPTMKHVEVSSGESNYLTAKVLLKHTNKDIFLRP